MSNPIDKAIASAEAAEAESRVVEMRRFPVTISSSGRPAAVDLPADATDGEIAELAGWLLTAVLNTHRAERAKNAPNRLVVATALPPKPS